MRTIGSLLGKPLPTPDRGPSHAALARAREFRVAAKGGDPRALAVRRMWVRRALQLRRKDWVWMGDHFGWQPISRIVRAIREQNARRA